MEVYFKEVRMKSDIQIVSLVATVLTACTSGQNKNVLEGGQSNEKPDSVNSTFKMAEVDPGLREALNTRQLEFFSQKQNPTDLIKAVPKFETQNSSNEVQ